MRFYTVKTQILKIKKNKITKFYYKILPSELPSQFSPSSNHSSFDINLDSIKPTTTALLSSNDDSNIRNSSQDLRCAEKIEILPGCEIVDRHCQCWQMPISVCSESSVTKWDFASNEVSNFNGLENFEHFFVSLGVRFEPSKSN